MISEVTITGDIKLNVNPNVDLINFGFDNAPDPLELVTYEGSGETIHPDVVYFDEPFNGFKFWMVNTPYPNNNSNFENISIWGSNNGAAWEVPVGVTNPLSTPASGFDSDPCMIFDTRIDKLRIYWRRQLADNINRILTIESSDGVTWTNEQEILNTGNVNTEGNRQFSPQVYLDSATNTYTMWLMSHGGCGGQYFALKRYTSTDGTSWTPLSDGFLMRPEDESDTYIPWQFNIKRMDGMFRGIVSAYKNLGENCLDPVAFFIESDDGFEFRAQKNILLNKGSSGAWDDQRIYQCCMLKIDDDYYLWYQGSIDDSGTFINKLGLTYNT